MNVSQCSFYQSSALQEGGVFSFANTVFNGSNLIFEGNAALKGGVIASVNSQISIRDSIFKSN